MTEPRQINPWIVAIAVMFGTFMEVLDTTVVNVSLPHIAATMSATIEVDAYGGRTFTGKVDSIAGATGARFSLLPPENATGNFVKVVQRVPVKIVLDPGQDPEHLLRPGMSVTPVVYTK